MAHLQIGAQRNLPEQRSIRRLQQSPGKFSDTIINHFVSSFLLGPWCEVQAQIQAECSFCDATQWHYCCFRNLQWNSCCSLFPGVFGQTVYWIPFGYILPPESVPSHQTDQLQSATHEETDQTGTPFLAEIACSPPHFWDQCIARRAWGYFGLF